MAETSQFGLPLLAAAQAQKHITVNEALAVIDAVAQLRFLSASLASPPNGAVDGDAYVVAPGATGDWFGEDGNLAISTNGFWRFVTPKAGWQGFNVETGSNQLFDGTSWLDSTLAATLNGTATIHQIAEFDHALAAGPTSTTSFFIPQNSVVTGVTGRVITAITGALTDWELGVAGSTTRYGAGIGLLQNSYVLGLTGTPTAYYADTPLELTASGGDFAGGMVRLAIHYSQIVPPRSI